MNLNSSTRELSLVGPYYAGRLERLGITTIKDLLYHVPHRYLDFSLSSPISLAQPGEMLTIKGKVIFIKNQYTRFGKKIQICEVEDASGKITVVWFNQPFLVQTLYPGTTVSLAGKIDWFGRKKALVSPEYEVVKKGKRQLHTKGLVPIYPETSGVSSKWLRGRIKEAVENIGIVDDFLPEKIRKREKLLGQKEAFVSVHFPKSFGQAEKARQRLAFDELLFLHLNSLRRKIDWQRHEPAQKLEVDSKLIKIFIDSLPFALTPSQEESVNEILTDMKKSFPMNRLLEGDVGSGKTVVAATGAFATFLNGYQTLVMAPTQILASQHFDTLHKLFDPFKIRVNLITSDIVKKDLGRADILVGTHSLIHKKAGFEKVALVIIDEQHRFGVEQRAYLVKKAKDKSISPHVLTMTATPIPRTMALTIYGDMDLSTLTEMPLGRRKITTWVVGPKKREAAYKWVEEQIKTKKNQAFVICPLIEESEKETMQGVKAATEEFARLQKVFTSSHLGLLHGRVKGEEKEKVLGAFRKGAIDILVATPVVEVGIDIPSATIMIIEAAERFGLAQLHQLRGRVGRSDKKSYCLVFSEAKSPKVLARLRAMEKGISGFELAELDLTLRGPGEMFGLKQHGFPQLKAASWQDVKAIKRTKVVAEELLKNYPSLSFLQLASF